MCEVPLTLTNGTIVRLVGDGNCTFPQYLPPLTLPNGTIVRLVGSKTMKYHHSTELRYLIWHDKWSEIPNRIASHPEEVLMCDNGGNLPIHVACYRPQVPSKVIDALIDAYPESVKEPCERSSQLPLHCALRGRVSPNVQLIQLLLQYYPDAASMTDYMGGTPLFIYLMYCVSPSLEITKLLVEAHPGAVRMYDNDHWYPLHLAACDDHWQVCKYLIDMYPDALLEKNKFHRTPRETADRCGKRTICDQLREEEVKRFGSNLCSISTDGMEEQDQGDGFIEDPSSVQSNDCSNRNKDRTYRLCGHCYPPLPLSSEPYPRLILTGDCLVKPCFRHYPPLHSDRHTRVILSGTFRKPSRKKRTQDTCVLPSPLTIVKDTVKLTKHSKKRKTQDIVKLTKNSRNSRKQDSCVLSGASLTMRRQLVRRTEKSPTYTYWNHNWKPPTIMNTQLNFPFPFYTHVEHLWSYAQTLGQRRSWRTTQIRTYLFQNQSFRPSIERPLCMHHDPPHCRLPYCQQCGFLLTIIIGQIKYYHVSTNTYGPFQNLYMSIRIDPQGNIHTPKHYTIHLRRGGSLTYIKHLLNDSKRLQLLHEVIHCPFYRQYHRGIYQFPEPRVHVLFSSKLTSGYSYHGVHMKAHPLSTLPKLHSFANDLAHCYHLQEWNIGVNLLVYRNARDGMGFHADDTQGETVIGTVVLEAPKEKRGWRCSRPLLVKVNARKGRLEGDEYIKLFCGEGDGYVMDGGMQQNYVHALPQRQSCQSRRTVVVFRNGLEASVEEDSGTSLLSLRPYKDLLTPRKVEKTTCMGISQFRKDLSEGGTYSREYLYTTRSHRQDRGGVNGNQKDGCDSLVVSRQSEQFNEQDNMDHFYYTCTKREGSGALFQSHVQQNTIRVFRSSRLNTFLSPSYHVIVQGTKIKVRASYRYDGLYTVSGFTNRQGESIRTLPVEKQEYVTFRLNRVSPYPTSEPRDPSNEQERNQTNPIGFCESVLANHCRTGRSLQYLPQFLTGATCNDWMKVLVMCNLYQQYCPYTPSPESRSLTCWNGEEKCMVRKLMKYVVSRIYQCLELEEKEMCGLDFYHTYHLLDGLYHSM